MELLSEAHGRKLPEPVAILFPPKCIRFESRILSSSLPPHRVPKAKDRYSGGLEEETDLLMNQSQLMPWLTRKVMFFILSLKVTFTLGPYSSNSCNIIILVAITLMSSKRSSLGQ